MNVEKRKQYNNNCHSMKRFNCEQVSNSEDLTGLKKKTDELHLFYNAEPCALQVLSSSGIKISTLILAIILVFLF